LAGEWNGMEWRDCKKSNPNKKIKLVSNPPLATSHIIAIQSKEFFPRKPTSNLHLVVVVPTAVRTK